MTKNALYLTLTNQLSPVWKQDAILLEEDLALWNAARRIDDWLVHYQDDDRVSVEQYARNCERLLAIYRTTT